MFLSSFTLRQNFYKQDKFNASKHYYLLTIPSVYLSSLRKLLQKLSLALYKFKCRRLMLGKLKEFKVVSVQVMSQEGVGRYHFVTRGEEVAKNCDILCEKSKFTIKVQSGLFSSVGSISYGMAISS